MLSEGTVGGISFSLLEESLRVTLVRCLGPWEPNLERFRDNLF